MVQTYSVCSARLAEIFHRQKIHIVVTYSWCLLNWHTSSLKWHREVSPTKKNISIKVFNETLLWGGKRRQLTINCSCVVDLSNHLVAGSLLSWLGANEATPIKCSVAFLWPEWKSDLITMSPGLEHHINHLSKWGFCLGSPERQHVSRLFQFSKRIIFFPTQAQLLLLKYIVFWSSLC